MRKSEEVTRADGWLAGEGRYRSGRTFWCSLHLTRVGCQIMHPRVTFRDPLPDRLYSSGNLGNRQESLEEESADIWEFHGALTLIRGIRKSTDMRISRTSGSRSLGRNIRRCQMPAPCERNSKRARRESWKLSRSRFLPNLRHLRASCTLSVLGRRWFTRLAHFILAGMDERTLPPRIERPDFHKLLFGVQSPDLLHLRFVLCLN